MLKRDYLMRMIEEAADVLAKLMGLRTAEKYGEAFQLINEAYNGFFDFDQDFLFTIDHAALIDVLTVDRKLTEEQMGVMAALLKEEAEGWYAQGKWDRGTNCLRKALRILEWINEQQPEVYSFDRMNKISRIEKRLKDINSS